MLLRRSAFAHALPLGPGRVLLVHALSQMRLAVDDPAAALLEAFATLRSLPAEFAALGELFGYDIPTLAGAVAALMERGFLTEHDSAAEAAAFAAELNQSGARDPGALLDKYRAGKREGAHDYWAARETRPLAQLAAQGRAVQFSVLYKRSGIPIGKNV